MAKILEVELVVIQGDSQLIIEQENGTCEAKGEQMKKYLSKAKQCIKNFATAKFHQIPREENIEADRLARAASIDDFIDDQIKV